MICNAHSSGSVQVQEDALTNVVIVLSTALLICCGGLLDMQRSTLLFRMQWFA